MAVDAVLFDLFGTLVPPYRRSAHETALRHIAAILGIGEHEVFNGWTATWDQRASGGFGSIGDNLRAVAPGAPSESIAAAEQVYHGFTIHSLEPKPGALDVLDWLRQEQVPTGLVTNCAPDVPELWDRTEWADRFDTAVFSCRFGTKKPAPAVYEHACQRLGVTAAGTIFVGDGSDRELAGAASVGMTPVLVRNVLDDTYDQGRDDVTDLIVGVVHHLDELRPLLAAMRAAPAS